MVRNIVLLLVSAAIASGMSVKRVLNTEADRFYKADGAEDCVPSHKITTEAECRAAGDGVGHPLRNVGDAGLIRPSGCYWDRNGVSYFNTNPVGWRNAESCHNSATCTDRWSGVGGICSGIRPGAGSVADEGPNGTRSADEAFQLRGSQEDYDRVMAVPVGERKAELELIHAEIIAANGIEGPSGTSSADEAFQLRGSQEDHDRVMAVPVGERKAELERIRAEIDG